MLTLEESLGIPSNSQKVTTTPAKTRQQERKDKTIDLMLNSDLSVTNIAKQIGISRKTLYNYWAEWQQTEEAVQINRKWHRLCKALEEDNMEKAFEGLTKIKVRMTTEKTELKEEITETHNVNVNVKSMLAEYEHLITTPINGAETQSIPRNNSAQPIHPAQANSEASAIPVT
jgi:transposase-like protein